MGDFARRPSPAMAVALMALFVSLCGVSYGVATGSIASREIKNGGVRGKDVKDGAIRGRDIRNNTLLGRDVRDGTLRGADVRNDALTGTDIAPNSIDTDEIRNDSIRGSDLGANALSDREIDETQLDVNRLAGIAASRYVKDVTRVVTVTSTDTASPKVAPPAACPRGKRLVGGGARIVSAGVLPVALASSAPSGNAWTATAYATAPTAVGWQLRSVAICG
jgi:hypothetical protein